ncbi:MAG: Nudix family hydrolase [Pseudohongiellaceae bacterium]
MPNTAADFPGMVHVAVGVIYNGERQVLVARRHRTVHQGNLWEFPGGKVEDGESVVEALRRELREELGIDVVAYCPLKKIAFQYPDKAVLLDVYTVMSYTGTPVGREGQPLAWRQPGELAEQDFPPANQPIIKLLQLPELIAVTGQADDWQHFERKLLVLLGKGCRLIQLRQPQLPAHQLVEWSVAAANYCTRHHCRLLFNGDVAGFQRSGAHGLHLNSVRLLATESRPVTTQYLFSASCHNLEQLRHAEFLGADFVFLSPVNATATHPESKPLGWENFASLAASVSLPVFALGGLVPRNLEDVYQAGGQGLASVSAFWQ